MAQTLRVTGWAPGGEPKPIAQLNMEFSFQLSDYPDETWRAAFGWAVGQFSADPMHANVHPTLMGDKIRVQCATTIWENAANGLKDGFVPQVNRIAAEREVQAAAQRQTADEQDAALRARISEQATKIKFNS